MVGRTNKWPNNAVNADVFSFVVLTTNVPFTTVLCEKRNHR